MHYCIGNWKMEMNLGDSVVLAESVKHHAESIGGVELIICPSHLALVEVKSRLDPLPAHLHLGAQDGFWEDAGAFTGEVSMSDLKPLVNYVLIAHSDRKKVGHETPEESRKKIVAALRQELRPIVFVGEFLRPDSTIITDDGWRELATVMGKLISGLPKEQAEQLMVAYEPVWAAGTGKETASGPYIESVIERMRRELQTAFGPEVAHHIPLLYGGSVNQENIHEVLVEDLQGVVVGRESLQAEPFLAIAKAVAH